MGSDKKDNRSIISRNSVHDEEKQVPTTVASKYRWKVNADSSPPEIYNRTLYLCIFVFGILGAARGFDEGNISGAMALPSFKKYFGLADKHKTKDELANLKSNIASMVQLGAIGGAMIAMYSVDKLGRVRALQAVCIIWIIGAILQVFAQSVGMLYAGRLIEGLAIGQTTTIGPSFTSEVAPKAIRGMAVSIFSGAVYLGIMCGYFVSYGAVLHISNDSRKQWVVGVSLKIVLAGLIFILSMLFCYESPRWLLKVGQPDKAIENLSKLRHLPPDHPYIIGEISDINEQVLSEKEAKANRNLLHQFKEIVTVKSIRYRFFAVCALAQLLGQWSGANAVTIYASELFSLAGIKGTDVLKMSAVLGVVKFISAYLCAFFIIDFLGRRRALYIGVTIQFITILYFAIFLHVVPQAADDGAVLTASQKRASLGALAALFLSGTGWTMGFNSIQYLLGSEIFPLKIRSFAQSLTMILHFANQYGNSKALPKMLLAMNNFGAFYFFCGVMLIGLFWCWFFVPEVAGRSLESMEDIFNLPWYLIGRKGPELCPDYSEINKITYTTLGATNTYESHINYLEKDKASQEFVENADEAKENRDSLDKFQEKV
ncbi:quinate permease [Suhomyces tanzawaensis NRRL Y-17324]|uniref:Quinate permease n=1 Tax=Suhomyces tanzawaensis NRRL Y-17324 TaxID=984487 RepID=A0A1E4SQA0_9ASCO|nr:quinate permease [Suhomyces tanzawaensis NRRL Y-17324]ODV81679.1 quinate permease [Suhomyces tanzawaensis NRRL Y-17324]